MGFSQRRDSVIGSDTASLAYRGDGGVSKAYLGYGFQVGNHLSFGFNAAYLFGKLSRTRSAEFLISKGGLSSRIENSNALSGVNLDLGAQYFTDIAKRTTLTIGYSATTKSKLHSNLDSYTTNYTIDDKQDEGIALDTVYSKQGLKSKFTLPMMHSVGFTVSKVSKWVLGADFNYGNWSSYREGSVNPGYNNSYGVAIGGQITPDVNSVSNYLKLIDYRVGFRYDKTYVSLSGSDIKETSVTFGLGLPLSSNSRSTFYKINIGTELGQRGTLSNNLVRERFTNIYLGFTINDKWFQKYKFD
jgi:long-subunit fatty acid transport protein